MATSQEQQAQQSMMPLQGEMQLVNYLSSLFGGKQLNPKYTGETVTPASLVPEMTGDEMSSVMTEWMRGQGNFLGNQRQQNLAGLYNTSTSKLVANDLQAQAALKAALANTQIKQGNSQLMNQYYSKLQNQQPQYLPNDPNQLGKTGAAAGIAALNSLLGKDGLSGLLGGDNEGGGLLDGLLKSLGLKSDTSADAKKKTAKKSGVDTPTLNMKGFGGNPVDAGFSALPEGGFDATRIDPMQAAMDSFYGESDPFISQLTADAVDPQYQQNFQDKLFGDFASSFPSLAAPNLDPMQGFQTDPWSSTGFNPASFDQAQFNPASSTDFSDSFVPSSDFSYITGGNDGADYGFQPTESFEQAPAEDFSYLTGGYDGANWGYDSGYDDSSYSFGW
jgi:hypothetical protein